LKENITQVLKKINLVLSQQCSKKKYQTNFGRRLQSLKSLQSSPGCKRETKGVTETLLPRFSSPDRLKFSSEERIKITGKKKIHYTNARQLVKNKDSPRND